MVLTGNYERALDDKLRLALPRAIREAFHGAKQLVLTPGTDGSLSLFAGEEFANLAQRLATRSPAGRNVRAFSRLLYAQSHSVEIDGQGRIRVPSELAALANIEGNVMVLGVGDHVEIWNKSRWEAYFSGLQQQYDQLAEAALSDSISAPTANEPVIEPVRPVQPR
jgi:MraZ protein